MTLRKNMRRRLSRDMRGKITCGKKSDKGYPQSLNHFNVSKFPELVAAYGNEPVKMVVFFPSNTIEDFFFSEYSLWGGSGDSAVKKRFCDGEMSTDTKTGECSACHCASLPDKQQCKSYTSIKAYIADPQTGKFLTPMCYQFETHSDNSSDGVYSEILKIWEMTGGKLVGVPFQIEVKFIKKVGGKQFPILHLQSLPNLGAIQALATRGVMPTSEANALPMNIAADAPQLAAPVEVQALPVGEAVQEDSGLTKTIAALANKDKTPDDQKKLIGDMVTLLVDGDMAQAGGMLESLTRWEKDGDTVRGYQSMSEILPLSGQHLNIAYGKVKTAFTKAFKKQIDEYAAEAPAA